MLPEPDMQERSHAKYADYWHDHSWPCVSATQKEAEPRRYRLRLRQPLSESRQARTSYFAQCRLSLLEDVPTITAAAVASATQRAQTNFGRPALLRTQCVRKCVR